MSTHKTSIQAPSAVVMVRPHQFVSNPETAEDNSFQKAGAQYQSADISRMAYEEVSHAAEILQSHGVRVHLFEDDGSRQTPDSVFPNNWFSTHSGGHVAIYPMYAPNRRRERRHDIIEMLKSEYRVQDVIDYSGLESDGLFLEGTGAMVLDHVQRVAYTARSHRADPVALERFCTHFNYEPMVFDTVDARGQVIYHANVMMCIATDYALIGLDCIVKPERRAEIKARLEESGKDVIELSQKQIDEFAGNALELTGSEGRILALSQRAYDSLTPAQRALMEESTTLVPLSVPTIELAGGSVRCMLAGVHLSRRPAA